MIIKKLSEIVEIAKKNKSKRLAVAAAADEPVLKAVKNAFEENLIIPVLIGNAKEIEVIAKKIAFKISNIEIIDTKSPAEASKKAVGYIKKNKAEILMKGMVSTGTLLKAVLDKENGLRKGNILSHVAIFESPYYHKLLGVTDAAMNIAPTFEEKIAIINNAVEAFNKLKITNPKVAVIGAVEVVNPKMEATFHAAILSQMNKRKQIKIR